LQGEGLVKPLYNAGTKVYLWERKNWYEHIKYKWGSI
jgi:hypothetical protein